MDTFTVGDASLHWCVSVVVQQESHLSAVECDLHKALTGKYHKEHQTNTRQERYSECVCKTGHGQEISSGSK